MQDDDGFHLTLSADETGSASFVGVTYSGIDPFTLASLNSDRDLSGTFTRADLDAVLTIENAFTVTRSSNTVSDVIQGVTLNLEQTGTTAIDIERDDDKIIGAVEQFIAAYNDVVSTIDELTANVLSTDRASLTNLEAQFRAVLNTAAIRRCSRAPSRAIPSASPISSRTAPTVWQYGWRTLPIPSSPPVGSSTVREQSINAQIDAIGDERTSLEFRLLQKQASLVDQFSALDVLIAELNTTSSFLSTQLEQIAAITNFSLSN